MLKAVIFDMDGVIVDNHHFHLAAWETFCTQHAIPFSNQEFRQKYFGKSNIDILTGLMRRAVSKDEAYRLGEEKEAMYRMIYADSIQPVNGLIPLLDRLRANGVKTAVATSAERPNLDFVMGSLGLAPFFDVLVDASYVEQAKPSPDIYLKAAHLLGVSPSGCIVFEDSVSGIISGKAAGMRVIGLLTTHITSELPECALFVNDFTDAALISKLDL